MNAVSSFSLRLALSAGMVWGSVLGSAAEPAASRRVSNYNLRPHDVIEIKVFQEDDLHSVLRISKDGVINFPLVGAVRVAGKSPQAAAETLRAMLSRGYLVNPQVSVTVREFFKLRFTILGEVQKPGAYELPDHDGIGLLEAIGMAGGYTRIAEPAKITLKRVINGRESVVKLNAKRMAREQGGGSVDIRPGDVITVGERLF
ncbi:MAG TPA: polysaccharide biosynthesis/export family protein [Chthoniobacteraceae bacterium]|nr:polysaccharide biosynthesis/export family protein [Chthoniobacteraceae bacterium]